ncbi:MAG: hypothetical protein QJR08_03875 [Bacillota bacterium]|nr:hypothetical protein [Bacillota bacterium]
MTRYERRFWLLITLLALAFILAQCSAGHGLLGAETPPEPVPAPAGWLFLGSVPGGWGYLDCGRLVEVVVARDTGAAVGAVAVLPTAADAERCGAAIGGAGR